MKKKILVLSLIAVLLISACAARSQSELIMESPVEMPAAAPAEEQYYDKEMEEAGYASDMNTAETGAGERIVIKQAYITVAVADPVESMAELSKLAEQLGGYVVSSNVYNQTSTQGERYPQSNVTVRVPAGKLEEVLAKIRGMAVDAENGVISESVTGQDVTSDYTDSQSRLRNLEAAEQQLVELLDTAESLEYTLDIFRELTNIRSEIEVLKGHIKYLEESAALSSISVDFVAEASIQPIQIGPWKPVGEAKEAVQALIRAAQVVGTGIIWFVITWLPFLIPIGLIIYFIVRGMRKRRAARKARKMAEAVEETPEA